MATTPISPADRAAIYDNLHRYAWCLDHADGAGVAATFTRDGVVEGTSGTFQGPEGIARFVAEAAQMPGFAGRQHLVQPLLVEPTPDGYQVTSYWMVLTCHAGSPPFLVYNGWYQDFCVQEEGAWRFRHKRIARWDFATAPITRY